MNAKYEYLYFGEVNERTAPDWLREKATRAAVSLRAGVESVLTCADTPSAELVFGPAKSNPAWRVTVRP